MTQATFPFFVGRARSGTTLLRAIFDSHPQLAIPPESHFIVPLRPRRTFELDDFVASVTAHERFRRWGLDEDDVRSALSERRPATYADAIRTLFSIYAKSHDKPLYGDKTPAYVYQLPVLAVLFPEARFVHIIRDGRDASLSFLRTEFASGGIEEAAFAWKVGVRRGRRAGARLGPERYCEVHYEALVDDPETWSRHIAMFLGLPFDAGMLTYFERADEMLANTPHPAAHQNLRRAPGRTGTDWRKEMSRSDLETFELIAGDLLDEIGYERGSGAPTGALARKLRLQARRAMRRALTA